MKNYVLVAVLVLLSTVVMQTLLIVNVVSVVDDSLQTQGKTVSVMSLCVSADPEIVNITCPDEFNQSTRIEDNSLECSVESYSFRDTNLNYSLDDMDIEGLNATIDNDGNLYLNASNYAVGEHFINIYATMDDGCGRSTFSPYSFEVLFVNDPPELIENIGSISLREGSTRFSWYLDEYFYDPDDPVLNYTVHGLENFEITINPETTEVLVSNPSGNCDDDEIYFTATDPEGLSVESNMITLEAICDDQQPEPSPSVGPTRDECEPKWDCTSWSECFPDGTRYRDCYDQNACDPDNYERTFWEDCEYIPPEDPEEPEEDDEEEEEEEEVQVETPSPVPDEDDEEGLFTLVLASILAFSLIAIGYLTFRKEIKVLYARLLWHLMKYERKQILLNQKQKEELLKKLNQASSDVDLANNYIKSTRPLVHALTSANRKYFSYAFDLPKEFTRSELIQKLIKLKREPLENAFRKLYRKMYLLETKKATLSKSYVNAYLEELRQVILNTSEINKKDFNHDVENYELKGSNTEIILRNIHNAYNALQFNQLDDAKKYYYNCLEQYELLDDAKKRSLKFEITKLYDYLTYVVSWNTKK